MKLTPIKLLREGKSERETYVLFMHDYLAEVIEGEPKITKNDPYESLKWELPEKQLSSMKVMGECCRLYKEFLESKQSRDK